MKIAVLGAGAFGLALGQVLAGNGYNVEYYDPMLKNCSLSKTLDGADAMLLAVPSMALPEILPKLPKDIPMIVATKGILDEKVFDEFKKIMVLSGPGFAKDIKNHKNTLLTTNDEHVIKMFGTEYLKFDFTNDTLGILMCGALKNVYAILAGLLNLQPGTEEHERFLKEVSDEMANILEVNGAQANTVDLACGKGDLRLTCSMPSRNYEFGQNVRLDPKYRSNKTVEGLATLQKISAGNIKIPDSAKRLKTLLQKGKEWN